MIYRLLLLSLGTFAIGTEGFMIAGVLPTLAREFQVSLSAAGQLVTIFSIAYAIGSPVLATMTGRLEKRQLLLWAMMLFAFANVVCGFANNYGILVFGRIIAAIAAGLFVPAASITAAALVPPEKRGRALSLVIGGQTVALALGVPLGTWIALTFQWRMTFWIVGLLAFIAALLIRMLFPSIPNTTLVTLKERLSFVRRPVIFSALLITVLWGIGAFTVYTYISDVFGRLGAVQTTISFVLLIWGLASFVGSSLGGWAADRFGSARIIVLTLSGLTIALTSLSVFTSLPKITWVLGLGMVAMALWGISAWAFNPAQQYRLIGFSGKASSIVISLNASAIYLGSSIGAFAGGLVLKYGSITWLGFIGGGCELAALLMFVINQRLASSAQPQMQSQQTL